MKNVQSTITLLDSAYYNVIADKVVDTTNRSFNCNGKVDKVFSNGWCPVSEIKRCNAEGGILYGRIRNELVPSGIYHLVQVENTVIKQEVLV